MSLDHHPEKSADTSGEIRHTNVPNDSAVRSSESFAEVALRLSGASAEEARRTGVLDTADDQVEDLFAPQYQTVQSPAHRAIWDTEIPTELFQCLDDVLSEDAEHVIQKSLNIVRNHRDGGTLLNHQGKIADNLLDDLGNVGFWGLLVIRNMAGSERP